MKNFGFSNSWGFGFKRYELVSIPVNTVAPVISGTNIVGQTLSCTTGTWTGGGTITYAYQWKRNGTNILGANSSTYVLVQADAGNTANITCVVTATNSGGSTSATSNTYVLIYDADAKSHYDRVIADGGIVPAGLSVLNSYIIALKIARGIVNLTTLRSYYVAHYTGVKNAAGTGQTAGNLAVSKIYNLVGASGDFVQTTAANQPLSLIHTGTNYVYLPRVVGNYFNSPYNAAINLRANFDIKAEIQTNLSGAQQDIFTNNAVGNLKLLFRTNSSNGLRLILYIDGVNALIYDSTVNIATITDRQWVRATRNSTTGILQFFTSNDGSTWTQLGTNVTGLTGNLFNGTNAYEVGSSSQGASINSFQGIIYRVLVSSTIGGSALLDFNPANYNRATSQSSWTSTTGEVWTNTVPNTKNTLKSVICDITMPQGNGTSYGMRAPSLTINEPAVTSYTIWRKYTNTAGAQIITELGANSVSASGKGFATGYIVNQEETGIYGNVGQYNARYTSTSLVLKHSAAINNIANANESSPYLVNNVSQTFAASDNTNNNTGNMNATGYNLLARNNAASLWANVLLVGDQVFAGEDNSTILTAMYNFNKTYINGI